MRLPGQRTCHYSVIKINRYKHLKCYCSYLLDRPEVREPDVLACPPWCRERFLSRLCGRLRCLCRLARNLLLSLASWSSKTPPRSRAKSFPVLPKRELGAPCPVLPCSPPLSSSSAKSSSLLTPRMRSCSSLSLSPRSAEPEGENKGDNDRLSMAS